jgi:Neocarzinostatin family
MLKSVDAVSRWVFVSLVLAGAVVGRAQAAPPKPAITVSPGTGLADGQTVKVAGTGYQKQEILIVECGGAKPGAHPPVGPVCSDYVVSVQADAQGAFPATDFVVHTTFTGTRYVKGTQPAPASHTCAASGDCYAYAYAKNKAVRNAKGPLSFATTP